MVSIGNRLALCCRNMFSNVLVISVFFVYIAIADIGLPSSHQDQDNLLAQLKLPQCREHCMDKVCLQFNVFAPTPSALLSFYVVPNNRTYITNLYSILFSIWQVTNESVSLPHHF